MALPQVADGGDGVQIERVVANILNMQSRQPKRGGPPASMLHVRLTNPCRKDELVTKDQKSPRTWTGTLNERTKRK
jgi:hypothetical protein